MSAVHGALGRIRTCGLLNHRGPKGLLGERIRYRPNPIQALRSASLFVSGKKYLDDIEMGVIISKRKGNCRIFCQYKIFVA